MNVRKLTPEILDELDPSHPDAIASRRDLSALNAIMGHRRAWRSWLRAEFNGVAPGVIAELGAGDGVMAADNVLSAFPRGGGELIFVDRAPCVSGGTLEKLARRGWCGRVVKADVFEWLAHASSVDAICANLFLHHFENSALVGLFSAAENATRVFAALEPRRSRVALAGVLALPLMDANRVTLHDARVSVEAGFRGSELSALWPRAHWECEERRSFPFSHWFCARKR